MSPGITPLAGPPHLATHTGFSGFAGRKFRAESDPYGNALGRRAASVARRFKPQPANLKRQYPKTWRFGVRQSSTCCNFGRLEIAARAKHIKSG